MKIRPNAMPHKLADHAKAVRLNMLLDGTGDIGYPLAYHGLFNPLVQRRFGHLNQKGDFWGNISYGNSDRGISVKALVTSTKIKRDDIAWPKYFFLRRDAVHNLLIDRGT